MRGRTAYYRYDSSGERIRKVIVNGVNKKERFYLNNFEVYRESISSSVDLERETVFVTDDRKRFLQLDTLIIEDGDAVSSPTTEWRYQFDSNIGSACLELDDKAAIISYEEYFPFGATAYHSGRSENEVKRKRFRYTGKERDEETGLYYYGARYYAPWLARFTSCDPMGMVDAPSLYAYVRNNPIMLNDPDGMQAGGEDEEGIPPIDSALEGDPDKGKVKAKDKSNYIVKEGDTLSEIAEDNDISLENLRDLNNLDPSMDRFLQIGTQLKLRTSKIESISKNDTIKESLYTVTVTDASGSRATDMGSSNNSNTLNKDIANYLRTSLFIGGKLNPFFMAEAIIIDGGGLLSGSERDSGFYFVLAGEEAGKIGTFGELAGGVSPELGIGVEVGRVDISGDPSLFRSDNIFGPRMKYWINLNPTFEGLSVGGSLAKSVSKNSKNEKIDVRVTGLQVGFGLAIPTLITGGFNEGEVFRGF